MTMSVVYWALLAAAWTCVVYYYGTIVGRNSVKVHNSDAGPTDTFYGVRSSQEHFDDEPLFSEISELDRINKRKDQ